MSRRPALYLAGFVAVGCQTLLDLRDPVVGRDTAIPDVDGLYLIGIDFTATGFPHVVELVARIDVDDRSGVLTMTDVRALHHALRNPIGGRAEFPAVTISDDDALRFKLAIPDDFAIAIDANGITVLAAATLEGFVMGPGDICGQVYGEMLEPVAGQVFNVSFGALPIDSVSELPAQPRIRCENPLPPDAPTPPPDVDAPDVIDAGPDAGMDAGGDAPPAADSA